MRHMLTRRKENNYGTVHAYLNEQISYISQVLFWLDSAQIKNAIFYQSETQSIHQRHRRIRVSEYFRHAFDIICLFYSFCSQALEVKRK